jgi:hypothetical protein
LESDARKKALLWLRVKGPPAAGLGSWRPEDNGGSTAYGSTGYGYDGTLVSNPVWMASIVPLVFNQVAGNAF